MRGRQTLQGQILTVIIIVLVGLIIISAVISLLWPRVRDVPIVRRAFWEAGGQEVTAVILGEEVEAHVVIEATQDYTGSVVVKVRKDVRFWFDSDFQVSTTPVNLQGGEQREIEIHFTPDEASEGGLRGYFIEVEFSATRTTWGMENSYPPRLTVEK